MASYYEINNIVSYLDYVDIDYILNIDPSIKLRTKYAKKMYSVFGNIKNGKFIDLNIELNNHNWLGETHLIHANDLQRIEHYINENDIKNCICTHDIEKYHLVYNTHNKNIYIVGSHCITRFNIRQACVKCGLPHAHRKQRGKNLYKDTCLKCADIANTHNKLIHGIINHELARNNERISNALEMLLTYSNIHKSSLPQIHSKLIPELKNNTNLRKPANIIIFINNMKLLTPAIINRTNPQQREKINKNKQIFETVIWSLNNRPDIRRDCKLELRLIKYLTNLSIIKLP